MAHICTSNRIAVKSHYFWYVHLLRVEMMATTSVKVDMTMVELAVQ